MIHHSRRTHLRGIKKNNIIMKQLSTYITEKLNIDDIVIDLVKPKNRKELDKIINKTIWEQGPNCDLNFIDTSLITDMSILFNKSKFNGDISKWDVSNVRNMIGMFYRSQFNGDISKWDVSNVTNMRDMFNNSKFNGDISNWNVSKVKDMSHMFHGSPLFFYPPAWY